MSGRQQDKRMSAVFVHVSDIHFGQERGDRVYIHADVKQQLIYDAKDVVSKINGGVASGILVTGDIAQSGKKTEYEDAAKWLDELAKSIGVEINCVQMVPGNHDFDRDKKSNSGDHVLNLIRNEGVEKFEEIMNNSTDRSALFKRFEDYDQFSFAYNCPLNSEGGFASEMKVNLAPGRDLRFIRFNSALLCHGGEVEATPELIIGARQFVIPRDPGIENVVLVHHPLSWYKDEPDVRKYIYSRARVFISGHEHFPKVTVESGSDGGDIMLLAAGATVPFKSSDDYTFTYNVIEFEWDEKIDGLSVTIHPRAWNSRITSFEADARPLDGKTATFRLACPSFRRQIDSSEEGARGPSDSILAEEAVNPQESQPFAPVMGRDEVAMESMPSGYEIARLRFFRDLFEWERLRILVEFDALSGGGDQKINQGIERRLFDALVRQEKLKEIEAMIDSLIAERNGGDGK